MTGAGERIAPGQVAAVAPPRAYRAGSLIVSGYMALAAVPVIASMSRGAAPWPIAAAHLVALAVLLATARANGSGWRALVADWLPLLVIPLLYAELPYVMAGIAPGAEPRYHDALIVGWEHALFGEPARTLAVAIPGVVVSELLHLCYFLYYPLIYLPPLLVYRFGSRATFAQVVTVLVATFLVCFAVFAVFPVQGPRYFGAAPAPEGMVRALVLRILEGGSSRGAAFPSSHVAVAVAQVVLAAQRRSRLLPLYAAVTIGLSIGAVYGGFHYGVDVVAGALLGVAVPLLLAGARARVEGR